MMAVKTKQAGPKRTDIEEINNGLKSQFESRTINWDTVGSLLTQLEQYQVKNRKGDTTGWSESLASDENVPKVGNLFHTLLKLAERADALNKPEFSGRIDDTLSTLYGYTRERTVEAEGPPAPGGAAPTYKIETKEPPRVPLRTVVPSLIKGTAPDIGPVSLGKDFSLYISDTLQQTAENDLGVAVTSELSGKSPGSAYSGAVLDVIVESIKATHDPDFTKAKLMSGNWSEGAQTWLMEEQFSGLNKTQIRSILRDLQNGNILDAINKSQGTTFGETLISGVDSALENARFEVPVFMIDINTENQTLFNIKNKVYMSLDAGAKLITMERRRGDLAQNANGTYYIDTQATGEYSERVGGHAGPRATIPIDQDAFQNVQITVRYEYHPDSRAHGGRAIISYNDERGKIHVAEMPLYYYIQGEAAANQAGMEGAAEAGGMLGVTQDARLPFAIGVNFRFDASVPRIGAEGETRTYTVVPRASLGRVLLEAPMTFREDGGHSFGAGAYINIWNGFGLGASYIHTQSQEIATPENFWMFTIRYAPPTKTKK